MPYVNVWIDEDDILEDYSDSDLMDELKRRGYLIFDKTEDPLFKIRQSYLLDSPEEFRMFVEKYLQVKGMPV